MVGRMLDEHLGRLNFWLMFAGFQLAFFPMHIAGLLGMPRRIYTYPAGLGWELHNMISTAGAYMLGLGILLFVYNVYRSVILGRGLLPSDNPWNAGTLDWATTTPPPNEGYRTIPVVYTRYPLWEQSALNGGSPGTDEAAAITNARAEAERVAGATRDQRRERRTTGHRAYRRSVDLAAACSNRPDTQLCRHTFRSVLAAGLLHRVHRRSGDRLALADQGGARASPGDGR
jgi:hypothetical protein